MDVPPRGKNPPRGGFAGFGSGPMVAREVL